MQSYLIDRRALGIGRCKEEVFENKGYALGWNSAIDIIENAPSVDAEPVRHGEWLWHEDWGHSSISDPPEIFDAYWICGACGIDLLQYLKSHFPDIPSYVECAQEEIPTLGRCPYCGAKMDGKDTNVPTKAKDGGKQDADAT